jgi:outer membrane protein OmpA-like peptidoglycan-associated protein
MRFRPLLLLALLLAGCSGTPRPVADYPPAPVTHPVVTQKPTTPGVSQPGMPHVTPTVQGPAGPLAPAGVGAYMDSLEVALRRHLHGLIIARQGDNLTVVIPNPMAFSPEGEVMGGGLLDSLSAVLRGYPHTTLQVGGFTDTAGPADRNLALTQQRARAFADALVRDGVPAARVTSQGFGETHLRIMTGDDKKEARNRRLEILIKAKPG